MCCLNASFACVCFDVRLWSYCIVTRSLVVLLVLFLAAEVERDLIPLAQHAPRKFADKLKTLVQLIGAFCRVLRSSIKVRGTPLDFPGTW